VDILEEQGITYLLVGSLASGAYGEPRLTHDIDVVVELRPDQAAKLCKAFPSPEYYVSEKAAQEAVAAGGQFNVIHPASGNKIDFMIARRDAWGRSQISRRRREQILPGRPGYTAAPEDVILGKLWYYHEGGSEKHLRDIAGMLQVSGDEIDKEYINHWAQQLGLTEHWQAVLDRLHRP
jgi:predicted nucleotidyltransferase